MTTRHKTTDNRDHTEDTDHRTQHANDADTTQNNTQHTQHKHKTHTQHIHQHHTRNPRDITKWRVWAVVPCVVYVVWCYVLCVRVHVV